MTKLTILLFLSLLSFTLSAQNDITSKEPISSCYGAVNIFDDGDYQLQFTGKKNDDFITEYGSLATVERNNQIWVSYIAGSAGELTFKAERKEGFVQMVLFEEMHGDICREIITGKSEIKRLHIKKDQNFVGLDYEIGGGVLYTLKLKEGAKIHVLFSTEEKVTDFLHLKWKFKPEIQAVTETKIVDRRYDDFAPTFRIQIKDKDTQLPLVAGVTIEGSRDLDGLYTGSDLLFNVERNGQIVIKIDVEGYFFQDVEQIISSFEDRDVIIEMESIRSGRSMKIEEIQFVPGTSEITESSIPKLNRLKDFLLLNADLNIEIQGHVFALGDNSFAGQRISEARAKRVLKYLVDNGVDRSRLSSEGYGNTRPIFEEPKFSYEEQANRRVEIEVK